MPKADITGWICTDPDQGQYCKVITEGEQYDYIELYDEEKARFKLSKRDAMEFLAYNLNDDFRWYDEDIILSTYTEQEKREAMSAYYTQEEIERFLIEEPMLVAECLFEDAYGYA